MGVGLDTYQGGLRQDLPSTTSNVKQQILPHPAFGIIHVSELAEARSTLGAIHTFEVDEGGGEVKSNFLFKIIFLR
jgi:hypothetical protein